MSDHKWRHKTSCQSSCNNCQSSPTADETSRIWKVHTTEPPHNGIATGYSLGRGVTSKKRWNLALSKHEFNASTAKYCKTAEFSSSSNNCKNTSARELIAHSRRCDQPLESNPVSTIWKSFVQCCCFSKFKVYFVEIFGVQWPNSWFLKKKWLNLRGRRYFRCSQTNLIRCSHVKFVAIIYVLQVFYCDFSYPQVFVR